MVALEHRYRRTFAGNEQNAAHGHQGKLRLEDVDKLYGFFEAHAGGHADEYTILAKERIERGMGGSGTLGGRGKLCVVISHEIRPLAGGVSQRADIDALGKILQERRGGGEAVVDHEAEKSAEIGDAATERGGDIGGEVAALDVHAEIGRKHIVDRGFLESLVAAVRKTADFLQKREGRSARRVERRSAMGVDCRAALPEEVDILGKCVHRL